MNTVSPRTPGRGWAYLGAVLGGAVSIGANVAHSYVPPAGALPGWHPESGAVVGAVVWPMFLFIAVEILARTAWPTGVSWVLLRWAGLLPVAGVAAFVSYRHLSSLLQHYGEEALTVLVGPLAVDGLMVVATAALIATGSRRHVPELPPTVMPATVPASRSASPEASQPARPAKAAGKAPRGPAKATRRPVEETRKLIEKVTAAEPDLTQEEVARKLAITDRRVRQVLAEAEPGKPPTAGSLNGATVASAVTS